MLYRLLGLLACTLTLTSCIVTYSDFPPVDLHSEPLPKKEFPIYYHVPARSSVDFLKLVPVPTGYFPIGPGFYPVQHTLFGLDDLDRVFAESKSFSEAIATSTPPKSGVYCSVDLTIKPISVAAEVSSAFSYASLFIIPILPYYSGLGGYVVRYNLYVDGELQHVYRYEITKKGVAWVVLLPFAWINLFTYDQKDAFRATAYQFLIDAERDGYFKSIETPQRR